MAIAKIGSTGSSAGAINYVLSENKEETKQPEILAGSFGTMAEIKQEFEAYNKQNPRIKNQATHISVSFSQGERVKTEKKIENLLRKDKDWSSEKSIFQLHPTA